MNINSVSPCFGAVNFGALRNLIVSKDKNITTVSLKSSSGDTFTKSADENNKAENMERNVVVTYDDVFIFETPKRNKKQQRKSIFGK
ncbi:MAG: hypothetical protein PHC34_11685 [Candidatus Gastranaerophilales bacterium]|nr:hypothetical protein [Candidatus Gastranaerophilales bacterium]